MSTTIHPFYHSIYNDPAFADLSDADKTTVLADWAQGLNVYRAGGGFEHHAIVHHTRVAPISGITSSE